MPARAVKSRVPPARTHPWMLRTGVPPSHEDRFFASWSTAKARITSDLSGFEDKFRLLGDKAGLAAVAHLREQSIAMVGPGTVAGTLDGDRRIMYRAELIRRQEL